MLFRDFLGRSVVECPIGKTEVREARDREVAGENANYVANTLG